jgi:glycosyltransferase involved in cell wall biosynthesis
LSILAFAYACEPGKGSEPEAGWSWARALATLDDTCVITRTNNAERIEALLPSIPERRRLSFVYVDLPPWARFWKKGRRGQRLYYLLWQVAALRTARRLRKRQDFEVVWHLTLANIWMGSLAPLAGGRFVFGPVGGGATSPLGLVPLLGVRGAAFEAARALLVALSRYLNPFARLAWRRAEIVFVQNEETRDWIPSRYRQKAEVFPNALIAVADALPHSRGSLTERRRTLLFAGMLLPLKGGYLAIKTLALLPDWRLVVCGSGPDEGRLRRLVTRLRLSDRVEFRGWVERQELNRIMREETDVLVFPSLHDQAGFSVAEASAAGIPSVCLNRGGPKLLGAIPVEVGSPRATAHALAGAILKARNAQPSPLPNRSQLLGRLHLIVAKRGILRALSPPPGTDSISPLLDGVDH